jgi:uracil phosphoribosyltransferase
MNGNVVLLPQADQLRATHTVIRGRNASSRVFTLSSRYIIRLLVEAARNALPFEKHDATTPVGMICSGLWSAARVCGVSAVRVGESTETELRGTMPGTGTGKILVPCDRRTKLLPLLHGGLPPGVAHCRALPLEPMLAAASPALAAPPGLERLGRAALDLRVVTSPVEDGLNGNAFMGPGTGGRSVGTHPPFAVS